MPSRSKKYRFALVSHAAEVIDRVRPHTDPAREDLFTTLVGLEDAVPTARALIQEGYDVVLGHGGTGGLIARRIGQPVVNIPITMLDITNALLTAAQKGRRMAITSFAAGREGFEIVTGILGMKVRQIIFNSQRELEDGVNAAVREGVDIIVGGGVSRRIADRLAVKSVIIKPGGQSIQEALDQARALAAARRREIEHHEQLRTILTIMDDGLISVDGFGNLNFFNRMAETLLGTELAPHLGRPVSGPVESLGLLEVLSSGANKPNDIIRINDNELVVSCLPILLDGQVNGAVGLLKEGRAIHAIDRKLRERIHRQGFRARYTMADIVAASPGMQKLITRAERYAQTEAAILVNGETGTGKELLAHALHNHSRRRQAPFVAVNCAALPETLLESELFGYEEGAFTGAKKGGKIGLFELADRGTIFLDEIGDIAANLQVRLLRVLESMEVMRVGGDRIVPVDVRVISSTHKDLRTEVHAGRFREDLYYRLAVLSLNIPPLRHRRQDIPELLAPLLRQYGQSAACFSADMLSRLQSHAWPGNIREMNSLVESYLILLGDRRCDEGLFTELCDEHSPPPPPAADSETSTPTQAASASAPAVDTAVASFSLRHQLETCKHEIIQRTLAQCGQNKTRTARRLGISTNTLWRALRRNRQPRTTDSEDRA